MKSLSFKYLVIEDDTNVWANIKRRMGEFKEWEEAGFSSEINDAIEKVHTYQPQLIFLDWSIKGGNAFQILDAITLMESYDPYVIFFTGYQSERPEIPQKIMNNYPMVYKYIVKPIFENLTDYLPAYIKEAKDRYLTKLQNTPIFIENEFRQNVKIIPFNALAVIQCEKNSRRKILYLRNNEEIFLKQTWKSVLLFFNTYRIDYFITHKRKSIINKSRITKISKPFIWLENDMRVRVSRDCWGDML